MAYALPIALDFNTLATYSAKLDGHPAFWLTSSAACMSKNTKQTSSRVASLAGKTLQSNSASALQRSLAGSALRQVGTTAQTGAKTEGKASSTLGRSRSAATTKTLAASVVSQSSRKR